MSINDVVEKLQVVLSTLASVDANVIALPVRSVGCLFLPDFGEHFECGLLAPTSSKST